jgi:class 3 adenylate cyclase
VTPIRLDGENLAVRHQTRYAKAGDVSIAYQVFGDGPIDLVHVPGLISHVEYQWEQPSCARFLERLGYYARVAVFDKRGVGLSDPVRDAPTFDERMDDIRAVMDAAGFERAALLGVSEGCALSALFAATYPDRVSSLVLYGAFPRLMAAPDYPWGFTDEEVDEFLAGADEAWGEGISLLAVAPDRMNDPAFREWWSRFERMAASPGMVRDATRLNQEIDVRDVLPAVRAPALLLHTREDGISLGGARLMAEQMPNARLIEYPGQDHWPWAGDLDRVGDEIEEFLTGARSVPEPDRVLATVLFTDIVASTERAADLGDRGWRDLLERHGAVVRRELDRHRGREVKTTGDGFLATFDGPARGIRCASAIAEVVPALGIQVRAGLHTGECEVINGDVGGIAVHTGARVSAAAGPGEVLVSSTVKDLVAGSGIEFEDRGSRVLKGVPGEWRLYAVRA